MYTARSSMDIIFQLIINALITGSTYALLAMAFNLMYATGRFFNLALGAMVPVGAYTAVVLIEKFNAPFIVCLIAGACAGGVAGFLFELCIYRPLRTRKASTMILLIASLGLYTACEALLALLFSSRFRTIPAPTEMTFSFGGGQVTAIQALIIVSAIIVVLSVVAFLKWSSQGRAIRAVSDDVEVSKIIGIDTEKIVARVFVFCSAVGGYAGVLIGTDTGIDPLMGFFPLFAGIGSAIAGGIGNVLAGLFGSLLNASAEVVVVWHLSGAWRSSVTFLILILFLLFRPRGIFGRMK